MSFLYSLYILKLLLVQNLVIIYYKFNDNFENHNFWNDTNHNNGTQVDCSGSTTVRFGLAFTAYFIITLLQVYFLQYRPSLLQRHLSKSGAFAFNSKRGI